MSDDGDKFRHSRRLLKDQNAVNKQTKIARSHGAPVTEPHRLHKRHAMDCGNPGCYLCGNPRRTHKDPLTQQEKRMLQDLDGDKLKNKNHLSDGED